MGFSIAIDGPAGAGKSTIARIVGKKLDLIYIDTGAMYRAIGYYFIQNNISESEADDNKYAVQKACDAIDIEVTYENGIQQIILNSVNITPHLREEAIGKMASAVAKLGPVRKKLVSIQQNLAKTSKVIMDGRDIGTCVLPDADIKIYLTASSAVRAKRRYDELTEKGITCDINEIEEEIIKRDYQDMHRAISPLKCADDAITVDTSDMNIDEVVARIMSIYEDKVS